ncbi:Alanine/arginine aminopeptidase [Zalerion maritima]|uniref:Aminopeptidase n=1 Tax=Zalerion maritima TaxID=339359 RepID=A0AAD5RS65_9PEZI|nr:Alanine/arginine aminopeptidase [Zalerion maritima]
MADRDILPDTFKPSHYGLAITDLDFKDWSYKGTVVIDGELKAPTKELVINALELKLTEATLSSAGSAVKVTSFADDTKKQRATLTLESEAPAGKDVKLTIIFTGILNNDMAGFYRSKYKPTVDPAASVPKDDDWHYMFSTQFEACDARRAFPCFDEPNLKATFDFAIEIPDDQVALSNMPAREITANGNGKKLVKFDTSPIMSTYLLAWAVGDFEYVEAFTEKQYDGKKLPVRVYTTRGLKEQGRWALEHAPKIIDYFSNIFGIDYPLPKSDLLAVHEFTHGAMENWGLVTYRTTAVLFDEKTSESRYRNRVAYVVAHELAHQWFGNLVTMDWWDELWLNEGFATWVGWLATDYLHPEWKVWAQFVSEGMDQAFKLDSIRASHPIHVPVRDALDVNQIFDHISYLKGCSTIRMLASHLGTETFLKGVSNYLKAHAYGNAKTQALWTALSEASGTDVNALMDNWIQKVGFPMLSIKEGSGEITVKQSRFLSTGDVTPEDDTTTWWVPLLLSGKAGAETDGKSLALTEREQTLASVSNDFYKLNTGATGFYRVNYPPERLTQLGKQLNRLSEEDKIFTIGSAYDMAFSGQGSTSGLLSFIQGMKGETDYLVWSQVLDSVGSIKGIFSDHEEIKKGLQNFTLQLVREAAEKVGWEFPDGEDYLSGLLRKRLILTAVLNGHEGITAEALKRFEAHLTSGAEIHPSLRTPVYRAAIKDNPKDTVPFLKKLWNSTPAVDGKEVCLSALGHARDASLIESAILPFLFNISPPAPPSDSVPSGDMHMLGGSLASNNLARPLQWDFVRNNWAQVSEKMANPVVLDRFVKISLQLFTKESAVDEIEEFFKDKDTSAFSRTLETVKDKVRARAKFRSREEKGLLDWLRRQGYA